MKAGRMLALMLSFALCLDKTLAEDMDQSLLWLENVDGEKALAWVRDQNKATLDYFTADPRFETYRKEALEILTARDRIVDGTLRGGYIYNFWQDEKHPKGIWRRADIGSYRKGAPHWNILLDMDSVASEGEPSWVYGGSDCVVPDFDRCIVTLSPGGGDEAVYREYDLKKKSFVEGGFDVPLGKSAVGWVNRDLLLVARDWGEGKLNSSMYPRVLKLWKRGTPLASARTVLETGRDEVYAGVEYRAYAGKVVTFVKREYDFYHRSFYVVDGAGTLTLLPLPRMSEISAIFGDQVLVRLEEAWRDHPAGSLVSFDLKDFLATGTLRRVTSIFDPGMHGTILQVVSTRDAVYVAGLEDVDTRIREFRFRGGVWTGQVVDFGGQDVLSIVSADSQSDDMLVARDGLLTPDSLYLVDFVHGVNTKLQSLPDRFDTRGLVVEKRMATSKDGTQIPYFIVYRKSTPLDRSIPVVQYAYGVMEASMLPHYNPLMGKLWLEKGGAWVLANIRGGGEYGPRWHSMATLEHRQRSYDDFFAVAEAVQGSGLSSPAHYGAWGSSGGGLLMGVSFTQRPELFNAIVARVPLMDMRRYNKLLIGSMWLAEFGNPDVPEQWAYISKYSPLQNVRKDQPYPRVLLMTSTKDDRVHPAHARKMAAKMQAYGHDVYYYESGEGGHMGRTGFDQAATETAIEYLYLIKQLGPTERH